MLGDITAHLLHKADQPTDRRQDVLHPSEMSHDDWCPRASYYRIRDAKAGKTIKPEQFPVGTLRIFDEGHSVHHKYQTYLREMGRLKGRWDCTECELKGIGFPDPPKGCPWCMCSAGVVYGEVPLDAEKETLISGSADGWVDRRLIEIKTVGLGTLRMDAPELLRKHTHLTADGKQLQDLNALWNDLARPFKPHIKQANIYLWIANEVQGIDVDEMEFIYEFKVNQQVKGFTIKPSAQVIDPLLAKAETVKIGLALEMPPQRAFGQKDKNPCKSCAWMSECYAEDPAVPEDGSGRGASGAESTEDLGRLVFPRGSQRRGVKDSTGPDRNRRSRTDEPVLGDGGVGGISRESVQRGTGTRKVRRVRPGNP